MSTTPLNLLRIFLAASADIHSEYNSFYKVMEEVLKMYNRPILPAIEIINWNENIGLNHDIDNKKKEIVIELRKLLTDRCNEDELRTICFDLRIDYDNLPGPAKAGKARELVTLIERSERLSELYKVVNTLRPDIVSNSHIDKSSELLQLFKYESSDISFITDIGFNSVTPAECDIAVFIFGETTRISKSKKFEDFQRENHISTIVDLYKIIFQLSRKKSEKTRVIIYRHSESPIIRLSEPGWEDIINEWKKVESFFLDISSMEGGKFQNCYSFIDIDDFERKLYASFPLLLDATNNEELSQNLKQNEDFKYSNIDESQVVNIPSGEFVIGDINKKLFFFLPDFDIGKYPVTLKQFRYFVEDKGYLNERWWTPLALEQLVAHKWLQPAYWNDPKFVFRDDLPVVGVSWFEALAYCSWLTEHSNFQYRLPTEAEWEKAARGTEGRKYTWGNNWFDGLCNNETNKMKSLTPVGLFSALGSDSIYGCADMLGNVYEWCSTRYLDYPYQINDGREDLSVSDIRILKGGSWYAAREYTNCVFRYGRSPADRSNDLGFRIVRVNK